jgi:hypothetical protein
MGIDPINKISIIIRILFAVTLFQQKLYIVDPCDRYGNNNHGHEKYIVDPCKFRS